MKKKKNQKEKKENGKMGNDLKVIYMFNGLIYIGERIQHDQQVQVKNVVGLAPGGQQGNMTLMEAFPFTDMDEVITLQPGSYIAITEVGDKRLLSTYEDAIKQIRGQKSGLILP
jgi:hypothetical protein